jgi:hypothetical protein
LASGSCGAGAGGIVGQRLGEALGWATVLARLPRDAEALYGTIVVETLIGVFIDFIDLDRSRRRSGRGWSVVSPRCR